MKTKGILTLFAFMVLVTLAKAQTEEVYYNPKLPQAEMTEVEAALVLILKETGNLNHPKLIHIDGFGTPKEVSFYEDRIEMAINQHNLTIHFSDLINYTIQIIQINYPAEVNYAAFSNYKIKLGELEFSLGRSHSEYSMLNFKKLADYLFYYQHQSNIKHFDILLNKFKPAAEQYRGLKIKPQVSEEQRKFIVQANSFNEQKEYNGAIDLYIKAIDVDQTAYPGAYSNLALLSAQINKFDAAIYYMRKYLMLLPDAEDARSCQDKIYVWEAQIDK